MNLWPLGIGGGGTGTGGGVVQVPVSGTFSDTIKEVKFLSIITDYTYGTSIIADTLDIEVDSGDMLTTSIADTGIGISVVDGSIGTSIEDTEVSGSVNIDDVTTNIKCDKEN